IGSGVRGTTHSTLAAAIIGRAGAGIGAHVVGAVAGRGAVVAQGAQGTLADPAAVDVFLVAVLDAVEAARLRRRNQGHGGHVVLAGAQPGDGIAGDADGRVAVFRQHLEFDGLPGVLRQDDADRDWRLDRAARIDRDDPAAD